jgi:hypothetical protein
LRAPPALQGYEVLVVGKDSLSRALATAFEATDLKVRRDVRGGGPPTVLVIHRPYGEPGRDGKRWLTARLADTRTSVILAAVTLPLDGLGPSARERAEAIVQALFAVADSVTEPSF